MSVRLRPLPFISVIRMPRRIIDDSYHVLIAIHIVLCVTAVTAIIYFVQRSKNHEYLQESHSNIYFARKIPRLGVSSFGLKFYLRIMFEA